MIINCFKDTIHAFMTVLLSTSDDEEVDVHVEDAKEEECPIGGGTLTLTLTSSLRKVDSNSKKKKVQWVDLIGTNKELAEIRVFEPCEEEDDIDRRKNCGCVIL